MEDDVGETFNLAAERVTVGAEQPVILVVACRKTFHLARLEIPRIETLGDHAALFAVDLEPLVPLHPYWNSQVQMAERPVGELNGDKPTVRAKLLSVIPARPGSRHRAGGVDQMATVTKQVVGKPIGFGIADGPHGIRARNDDRMEVVSFRDSDKRSRNTTP